MPLAAANVPGARERLVDLAILDRPHSLERIGPALSSEVAAVLLEPVGQRSLAACALLEKWDAEPQAREEFVVKFAADAPRWVAEGEPECLFSVLTRAIARYEVVEACDALADVVAQKDAFFDHRCSALRALIELGDGRVEALWQKLRPRKKNRRDVANAYMLLATMGTPKAVAQVLEQKDVGLGPLLALPFPPPEAVRSAVARTHPAREGFEAAIRIGAPAVELVAETLATSTETRGFCAHTVRRGLRRLYQAESTRAATLALCDHRDERVALLAHEAVDGVLDSPVVTTPIGGPVDATYPMLVSTDVVTILQQEAKPAVVGAARSSEPTWVLTEQTMAGVFAGRCVNAEGISTNLLAALAKVVAETGGKHGRELTLVACGDSTEFDSVSRLVVGTPLLAAHADEGPSLPLSHDDLRRACSRLSGDEARSLWTELEKVFGDGARLDASTSVHLACTGPLPSAKLVFGSLSTDPEPRLASFRGQDMAQEPHEHWVTGVEVAAVEFDETRAIDITSKAHDKREQAVVNLSGEAKAPTIWSQDSIDARGRARRARFLTLDEWHQLG